MFSLIRFWTYRPVLLGFKCSEEGCAPLLQRKLKLPTSVRQKTLQLCDAFSTAIQSSCVLLIFWELSKKILCLMFCWHRIPKIERIWSKTCCVSMQLILINLMPYYKCSNRKKRRIRHNTPKGMCALTFFKSPQGNKEEIELFNCAWKDMKEGSKSLHAERWNILRVIIKFGELIDSTLSERIDYAPIDLHYQAGSFEKFSECVCDADSIAFFKR